MHGKSCTNTDPQIPHGQSIDTVPALAASQSCRNPPRQRVHHALQLDLADSVVVGTGDGLVSTPFRAIADCLRRTRKSAWSIRLRSGRLAFRILGKCPVFSRRNHRNSPKARVPVVQGICGAPPCQAPTARHRHRGWWTPSTPCHLRPVQPPPRGLFHQWPARWPPAR